MFIDSTYLTNTSVEERARTCGRLVLPVLLSRLDETDDLHELLARLVPLVLLRGATVTVRQHCGPRPPVPPRRDGTHLPLVVRAGGVGAGRLSGPLAMALSGGAGPETYGVISSQVTGT